MLAARYERAVFVNCPFDEQYRPTFEAIIFAIQDCGYSARSALEMTDASQVRIEKICGIIASCKFGLHDISRTELDAITGLPRFNMPLELGLFLGAKRFGEDLQREKNCLIFDIHRFRFRDFISDIAGQDISTHGGNPSDAIKIVRNWLSDAASSSIKIPGGSLIARRYEQFRSVLPETCEKVGLVEADLTFNDYVLQVEEWLRPNAWVAR
jgi:hypothetical protein